MRGDSWTGRQLRVHRRLGARPSVPAVVFALAGSLLLGRPVSAQKQPFTAEDLVALDRIVEHVAAPDGTRVAFVVSSVDLDGNRRRTDLWAVNIDGSGLRRLTDDEASDTGPVWSKDGRSLFFLSTRSGSAQVWAMAVDAGTFRQVTQLPLPVGAFALSPDDGRLAVAMEVFVDCDTLACTTDRLAAEAARKSSGRLFDRLFVRHWDTWDTGRQSHLFVVPATTTPATSAVDVMKGMDADVPSKPFGGAEDFTFSPDGRSVVFSARIAGATEPWSTNFDLYVAPVDGSTPPRNLTSGNKAWDTGPVFSPDGTTLAYRAMARPGYESDRQRIVLRAWPDGEPRVLTEAWDRSANTIRWSRDGRVIYTTAADLGQVLLFGVDAASGEVEQLIQEGHVTNPSVAGERLVVSIDSLKAPANLFLLRPGRAGFGMLTTFNRERLTSVVMGEPVQITFKGWNDETVHGWIVQPARFDPSRKYPVAFLIHGGPQGSFANEFHYRWNAQVFAGAGYGVVMIDFHGSTGYGQAFTDAIRGDWGGKPLVDLQKGLEAALAQASWLDGDRVCALGASYGGYMVNWIAGQWPDRFRCLVNHDGNLDQRFAYYATEELWFPEWEHGGTPWEHPEEYAKHNPVEHVDKWKTPMLVIHGARDFRVVETQGLATFTTLQRRGIPSRLLYFPDENHWVLKPQNSLTWHETVLDWLRRWTE
jgi:dipeptidyl aminopeptidase/acylaminoacyl peptidase